MYDLINISFVFIVSKSCNVYLQQATIIFGQEFTHQGYAGFVNGKRFPGSPQKQKKNILNLHLYSWDNWYHHA